MGLASGLRCVCYQAAPQKAFFYSQGEDVQLHWNSRWWWKFQWCGLLADKYSSEANAGNGVRVTLWLSRLSTIWEIWIEKWKIAQSLAHAAVSLSPLFKFSPAGAPFSSFPLHCACGCTLMAICQCLVRRGGVCRSLSFSGVLILLTKSKLNSNNWSKFKNVAYKMRWNDQ